MVPRLNGPWYPDFKSLSSSKNLSFYPLAIALDANGKLCVADNFNHTILRLASTATATPRIDLATGPVGARRQLDINSASITSWNWSLIRRPTGSTAELSTATIRNPTFTPDVADLYVFRLQATNAAGAICTRTVELNAVSSTIILSEPHPELSNNAFRVSVPTAPGKSYTLEFTDSMIHPNWTTLFPAVGDGRVKILSDPAANVPRRYYRVRVE